MQRFHVAQKVFQMNAFPSDLKTLLAGPQPDSDMDFKIAWAGMLVDAGEGFAFAKKTEQAKTAYDRADALLAEAISSNLSRDVQANNVDYFIGNLWYGRKHLENHEKKTFYLWGSENIEKSIYHYRRALSVENHPFLDPSRHAELLTNLANMLNTSGRFTEAVETWKAALKLAGC